MEGPGARVLGGARGIRARSREQILAFHTHTHIDTRKRSGFFSLSLFLFLSCSLVRSARLLFLSAFIELLAPSLNSQDPSTLPRSPNGRSSTGFFFVAPALALSRTSSRTRPPCGLRVASARLQRIYHPSGSQRFLADRHRYPHTVCSRENRKTFTLHSLLRETF